MGILAARLRSRWAKQSDPRRVALALLSALSVVALLQYVAVSGYVRYVADDFCSAAEVNAVGWVQTQAVLYQAWSGRFAATGLATTLELGGPGVTAWIAPALIVCTGISLLVALRSLGLEIWLAATGASLATFMLVAGAPQGFETFYWLTGATTYAPPLILLALAFAAAARGWLLVVAVLGCLSAGFSETAAALQLAGSLTGLVLLPSHRRALTALLIGSTVGALIVAAAPGNALRAATLPQPDLALAAAITILGSIRAVGRLVVTAPGVILLAIGLPLLVAASGSGDPGARRRLHRLTMPAAILVLASVFPAAWATSGFPPDRALIYPAIVVLGWLGLLGWAMGSDLGKHLPISRTRAAQAILALAVVPIVSGGAVVLQRPEYAAWAASVDTLLREAAAGGVVVGWSPVLAPPPLDVHLNYPAADAAQWANGCMARFLGVSEVTVLP